MLPEEQPTSAVQPPSGLRTGSSGVWKPPLAEELQAKLPAYEVLEIVGCGGMGAVYKARQKSLRRLVAIKVLPPEVSDDELKFRGRFRHEAETMAKLSHPGIVAVHDFGETGEGLLYFVMEFIDGTDVARLITSKGALPVEEAVRVTGVICDALGYAHRHGVIHRDIKPANVLIDREGGIKVADFGLAKIAGHSMESGLTRTNVAMGTQEFAAPEQLTPGAEVDHRADIYSLGVMLYQMLTGEVPRVMFKLPSRCRPALGTRFDALICKALETDPADRFQTVEEFRHALEAGATKGTTAKKSAPVHGACTHRSAHAIIASATAVVLTVALAGWFLLSHKHGHASIPEPALTSADDVRTRGVSVIKLWDTEQKVPKETAVRWENGALVLGDADNKGMLNWAQPRSRDVIFRAEIRVNPDAEYAQLRLRYNWTEGPGDFYRLQLHGGMVDLSVSEHGKGREIKAWPLPRAYGPDEWARLELRAVGDELTASLDGQVLETLHDSTLSGAGSVMIVANKNGCFRHVEYVPLDKEATSLVDSILGLNAFPLWSSPEQIPKRQGISWEDGAMRLEKTLVDNGSPVMRDAILRALVRMNREGVSQAISLRGSRDVRYTAGLSMGRKVVMLEAFQEPRRTVIREWPFPRSYSDDDWVPLEIRVVGDAITVWFDGKELETVHDSAIKDPGRAQAYAEKAGFFRDVVLIPLDKPVSGPTTGTFIDLLPLVDVKRDAIGSEWSGAPEGAVRSKPGKAAGRLEFPYAPPAEYDFEIEFTVEEGNSGHVSQIIAVPGHWLMWTLLPPPAFGPDLDGIKIGAKGRTEGIGQLNRLKPGDRHRSLVEVRKNSLRALVDGKEIARYTGDFKRLSDPYGFFKLRDTKHIGVAFYSGVGLLLHKATVREVSGTGTLDKAGATATTIPSGWTDWTHADLQNQGWLTDGGGFTTDQLIRGYNILDSDTRDGAARLTYSLRGASGVQITARSRLVNGKLEKYVAEDEQGALQIGRMTSDGSVKSLQKLPYPSGITREGEHTLELRIVGDTLTATLNGKLTVIAKDSTLPEGSWALVLKKGALAKKLEVQTPRTNEAVPAITNWQDLTETVREKARAFQNLVVEPGVVRHTGSGDQVSIPLTRPGVRDYAIRLRFVSDGQVTLRTRLDGSLYVLCQRNQTIFHHYEIAAGAPALLRPNVPHPAGYDGSQPHELLVTMQGSTLRAWLDDRFVGEAHDTKFQEGDAKLVFTRSSVVHKVEVAELEANG